MKIKVIYLLMSCCLLVACNPIPGTYVANHGVGTDTIKILPNHKYIRICYPNAPKAKTHYIDTGTWSQSNGIWFNDWYDRNGINHAKGEGRFYYGTEVDRAFFIGKMRLLIDDDMDYYYIKQ